MSIPVPSSVGNPSPTFKALQGHAGTFTHTSDNGTTIAVTPIGNKEVRATVFDGHDVASFEYRIPKTGPTQVTKMTHFEPEMPSEAAISKALVTLDKAVKDWTSGLFKAVGRR